MGSDDTGGLLDGNREAMHEALLDDAFAQHLGAVVTDWGGGWARATLTVADHHAR